VTLVLCFGFIHDLIQSARPRYRYPAHSGGPRLGQTLSGLARPIDRSFPEAVPGYPPHPELLKHLAAAAGTTAAAKYGDIYGDQALRDVLATELTSLYRGNVEADEIAITSGCNQAFVLVALALAKAGDNILLPSPWYFNHQMTLNMLGIEPRALPARAEHHFIPDPKEAEALIDASTRAIVLVTPNNPTGAIYPPATIAAFAALCRLKGIWLIVDEPIATFSGRLWTTPRAFR